MIRGLKSESPEPTASPEVLEKLSAEEPAEEEEEEDDSLDQTRSPSPSPPPRSPSPEQERSRSASPERKDSRGSHGSSSYDEERASSLSPEPPKVIATPSSTKVTSPLISPVS